MKGLKNKIKYSERSLKEKQYKAYFIPRNLSFVVLKLMKLHKGAI